MRIGFLTYGVERPLSGVTRVALELGRALARLDAPDLQVVYLTTYRSGPFRGERGQRSIWLPGCRLLPGLMALGGATITWAARLARLDAIHDPVGIAPFWMPRHLAPYFRIVTLHDAIAYRHPEGYSRTNNFLHRVYIPHLLPGVDEVITVSEHAKSELLRFLPLAGKQISIIPNAVSDAFRPCSSAEQGVTLRALALTRPYLLSLCAQQERKNLPRLIRAFARVRQGHPELKLALAGPTIWTYRAAEEAIAETGAGDAVVRLGYVAERHLAALYSAAEAFVFPSLYEGFGLPVLEAMACGCPVVAAAATSLPEVVGDAAEYVDPHDAAAIASGVNRVLSDPERRSVLRERGIERSQRYRWERVATEVVDVYRSRASR